MTPGSVTLFYLHIKLDSIVRLINTIYILNHIQSDQELRLQSTNVFNSRERDG